MQPCELSFSEASAALKAGKLSPVELTDSCLARLEAVQPTLAPFAHVTADAARRAAKAAEKEIAAGRWRGPLHGIPLGIKDIYDTGGVPSTSSSQVRAGRVPERDAVVVARLRQAGAVLLGQTHTHEFAYGGVTPTTHNPWNPARIVGGSSGGSAAAIAAGVCTIATGTDTAGSIRIPSAFCGTVGLKSTYGRVSRRGVTPLAWSLDHAGALTRNVGDSAAVLQVIAGYDAEDPASVDLPVPDYGATLDAGVKGLRIGVPENYYFDHVAEDVAAAVRKAIDVLRDAGALTRAVAIPYPDQILGTEWAIMMAEASAYHQESLRASAPLYQPDVRALLRVGEFILATDYIKALRVRQRMRKAWEALLADVDVVIAPTMPITAPAPDTQTITWPDGTEELIVMTLTRFTCQADLTGLPTMSLPAGFDRDGLPIGMQIIGRAFDEQTVLRAGRSFEKATDSVGRIAAP
ncbi:MAG TPA: amidase [Nevskiaceae bacterium]